MKRCVVVWGILAMLLICGSAWAGSTTMVNGTWVSNMSPELISAEINGKSEIVCLPRLEFTQEVSRADLSEKLRKGIRCQDAIFHLYHDGLGTPLRKNNMLFASDIFLKENKGTFIGVLRELGLSFKVSKKLAMEDPQYLREIAAEGFINTFGKKNGAVPGTVSGDNKPGGEVGVPSGSGNTGQGFSNVDPGLGGTPAGLTAIQEKYQFLPPGVLPPSMRKMKQELDARIREIKNRPYKAEIPRVDAVRWAAGKMGTLARDGTITGATIAGQVRNCWIQPPQESGWLTAERVLSLASQTCEFVLQRDLMGREARRGNSLILADLYLTDLGQTWNEWLTEQKLKPASSVVDPKWATGTVTLKIQSVFGIWQTLLTPSIARLTFSAPSAGIAAQELVRLPLLDFPIKDFKTFVSKLNARLTGKTAVISLLYCQDDRPYEEMGQKRALRVNLPDLKDTLQLRMKRLAGEP